MQFLAHLGPLCDFIVEFGNKVVELVDTVTINDTTFYAGIIISFAAYFAIRVIIALVP